MITKSLTKSNSDIVGALASTICLIHCVATPFIFMAHAGATNHHHEDHHHDAPIWWQSIDFIFITISFFAIQWSIKNTSIQWIKTAFWIAWGALTLFILNEKIGAFHIPENVIYIPALSLVGLHLYNKRYCQCNDEDCCS